MTTEETTPLVEREPAQGTIWGPEVLERTGLEMMRAAVGRALPDPPITRLTGLRLTDAGLGTASSSMPASFWWQSGAGVFLAGSIAFAADLPLASAVLTTAPAGTIVTSSELSVSFVRPATIRSGAIVGHGRVIHSTRSLGLAEGTIEDAQGRLLGHATSRCVLVRPEATTPARAPRATPPSDLPDPYLRPVEGVVQGQEYWNTTDGIDMIQQVVAGGFLPPAFLLFGLRVPSGSEGELTMTMPASPWLRNALGAVYGGALAMHADAAMTLAVASTVPAATAFSPLDMKIYFLRPPRPDGRPLAAHATVHHRGRTIAVVSCDIIDADQRVLAQATGSLLILPGRPWERPVHVADEFTQDIDRIVATIMFIDIVGSTELAGRIGDQRWKALREEFFTIVRAQLQRFRGTEIDTAGDGVLVRFDGAARAIRCAAAIRDALRPLDLRIRVGIHTGECEVSGTRLVGVAVHVGARLASAAEADQILVSSTVKELAGGSSIVFEDRGSRTLKGLEGEWHVYAASVR